jgi:PAS domain S-box-containing protein
MDATYKILSSIIQNLSQHPEGLMMKDLAGALSLNRNAVAKYVGILYQQGQIDLRHVGKAKVFTISKRIPFSILAELSPDYIVGFNRNMSCAAANTRFYEWSGCTPEDILGKHFGSLAVPVLHQPQIADLAKTGISSVCEPLRVSCTFRNKDVIYEIRCQPVIFGDSTSGSALIIKDITNSETTAAEISLLEQRYRALADAQSEYIVHSLPDGTLTYANPAFAKLAGVSAEQLVGKKYRLNIPEDDLISINHHFHSIRCDDPEKSMEHRVLVYSGEIRWIRWTNRGIFRNGTLIEYHSHGTDITELKMSQNQFQIHQKNIEKTIRKNAYELEKITQELLTEIQKRKLIEWNLRKTQFCVNNSSEMILWIEEGGTIVSTNKSALTVLGTRPGHTLHFMKPGVSDPPQQIPWQDIWESAKQNGYALFEAIIQDRTDKPLPVEVLCNIFHNENGYCCFFIRDITIRKQAEEALRVAEEKYRLVVENTHNSVYIYRDNQFLFINSRMSELTGYSDNELIATPVWDLIHPDDRDLLQNSAKKTVPEEEVSRDFIARIIRKNGEVRDCEFFFTQIMFQGQPAFLSIVHDITERKRAEESLRESEGRFIAFMDHLPVTAFIKDEQFTNLFINRHMVEIFGAGEWIGKSVLDLFPKEAAEKMIEDDRQTFKEGYRKTIENLVGKNGDNKIFETHKFRIDRENNTPLIGGFAIDVTEQKQADDALKESEKKYRTLVENVIDIVYQTDRDGTVVFATPFILSLLGYDTLDDIIGHPITSFWANPEKRDDLLATMKEKGHVKDYEIIARKRDGTKIPVSISSHFYQDDNGCIAGVEGIIRDITERKRAEEALLESEQRYRRLISHSFDAVVVHQGGRIVLANDAAAKISGFASAAELVGRPVLDFVYPEFQAKVAERIQQMQQSLEKSAPLIEEKFVRNDGTVFDVEVMATITQHKGQPAVMVVFRDITERKQMEMALRDSETKYRAIFDNAVIGIYQVSRDGRFLSANDQAARILGYESAEELIQLITDIDTQIYQDPKSREEAKRILLETGVLEHFEVPCRHKDGHTVWVSFNARLVRDADGNILYHEGTSQDITERKQMELALRQSQELYTAAFYHGPLMLSISDIDTGRYLDINNWFTRISGYSRDEAIGKTSVELGWISPEDRESLFQELTKTGRVVDREIRLTKKDGEAVWSLYFGEIITVAGKERLLSLAEDITDRKLAEEALRESQEKYRGVFAAESDGIVVVDRETEIITDCNDAFLLLYGHKKDEIIGQSVILLSAEPDASHASIREGITHIHNRFHKRKDGSVFPVEIMVNIISLHGRDVVIAAIREITEKNLGEESLPQAS